MSQNIMGSPSKKVRHESSSNTYIGNHAPESPIQQTSTGANSDRSLFGFEFSDIPTFNGGTPTMSYLPSQVPDSKDWMMSPTAGTFSAVPEGFGLDPLSPGFSTGVPSRTSSLKLGNNGHQRGFRNAHKRGGGAGSSSVLYSDEEFDELNGELAVNDNGSSGLGAGNHLSGGIALGRSTPVMDEESQEQLSSNKKTLADILNRKSGRKGGRATPDHLGNEDTEGTRHGLSSSSRNTNTSTSAGAVASHHPTSLITSFPQSLSTAGTATVGGSQTSALSSSRSRGSSTPTGSSSSSSQFDFPSHPTAATSSSNNSKNNTKTALSKQKIKAEAERPHADSSTTNTIANDSIPPIGAGEKEDGGEDDNSSSTQQDSQNSGASLMAGLLAITTAAEYLPFPSSDEKLQGGKGPRSGTSGTPGRKGKVRRSYGLGAAGTGAGSGTGTGSTGGLGDEAVKTATQDGEHSNLSYESHSSGGTGNGTNGNTAGGAGAAATGSSANSVNNANAMAASFLAAYGTPAAMKLTSSIASASSSKPINCNCKRSRCLKMYCDCFRLTLFCKDSCRCKECANVESKAAERQAAISSIVDRNPEAFKPRVTADPVSHSKGHLTGCHCRKSSCLKKYCECFTGAVPCGERCRCLDCKNAPAIYGSDLKQRLSLSSALGAGIDRGHPRKDSIGSDNNMDVMAAIMNDKRQMHHHTSALAQQSLGSPHMQLALGSLSSHSAFYDPEMSNLSTGSMSYSNDAFTHAQVGGPYGAGGLQGRFLKSVSDPTLAFSPARPGTDNSSGANSNRSVLDNEDAAGVLSAMNSPSAAYPHPSAGPFAGIGGEGGMFRYRDTGASSVGTTSSFASHSQGQGQGRSMFGKSLLHADFDEADDNNEEEGVLSRGPSQPDSSSSARVRDMSRQTAGMGLSIHAREEDEDNEDNEDRAVPVVTLSRSYPSPPHSPSAFSSPVRTRQPVSEHEVLSPKLLDFAALCERKAEEEEEERKQQLTSPVKPRSFP